MTDHNLNELSKASGEDTVKQAPRYDLPIIRLQGKEGKFIKGWMDNDAEEYQKKEIGDKLSGVVLKVRRTAGCFSKNETFFTNEHNSWKDNVSLFYRNFEKETNKTQMIDSGRLKDLKVKYPTLKMRQILYLLVGEEIIKVEVKGKGLSNLFEYYKEFAGDEHIFQFKTEIGMSEEESPLGKYYAITFKREEESDLDEVAPKIKEVVENLEKVESYYAEQGPVNQQELDIEDDVPAPEPPPEIKDEDIPVVEE